MISEFNIKRNNNVNTKRLHGTLVRSLNSKTFAQDVYVFDVKKLLRSALQNIGQ